MKEIILDSMQGLWSSSLLAVGRAAARTETNRVFAVLVMASRSIDYVNRALIATGTTPMTGLAVRGLTWLPVGMAIAKHYVDPIKHNKVHQVVCFLDHHVDDAYCAAAVIASIACFYFNQRAFAAASLVTFGTHFLEEKGVLPPGICAKKIALQVPLMVVVRLYFGSFRERIFIVAPMIGMAAVKYLQRRDEAVQSRVRLKMNQLTQASCDLFFSAPFLRKQIQQLELNPDYLQHRRQEANDFPDRVLACLEPEKEIVAKTVCGPLWFLGSTVRSFLGLPYDKEDILIKSDMSWLIKKMFASEIRGAFNGLNTPEYLIASLLEANKQSQLTTKDITDFFSRRFREIYKDSGRVPYDSSRIVNRNTTLVSVQAMAALLVDIGVLRISSIDTERD